MFYSLNILCKKDGKFAVIWMAATKVKKLKRREIESVNVEKTCNSLMRHLPRAGDSMGRTPRSSTLFSLYLASQLMYGTIVVYNKQHKYLLDDVQQVIDRIKKLMAVGTAIDMERPFGRNIDMPDPLAALDEMLLENFGQPIFRPTLSPAVMDFGDQDYLEVQSARTSASEEVIRCVVPPASITLQEDDWNLQSLWPQALEEEGFEGEELPTEEGGIPPPNGFDTLESDLMPPPVSPITRPDEEHVVEAAAPFEETPMLPPPPFEPPPAPGRVSPQAPDVTGRPTAEGPDVTGRPAPERRPRERRRREALAFELSPIEPERAERRRRAAARRRGLIVDRNNMIAGDEMNRQINNYEDGVRTFQETRADPARDPMGPMAWMQRPGIGLGNGIADLFDMNLVTRLQPGEFRDIFQSPPWAIGDAEMIEEEPQPQIIEQEQMPPIQAGILEEEMPEDQRPVDQMPPADEQMPPQESVVTEPDVLEQQRRAEEEDRRLTLGPAADAQVTGIESVTPARLTGEPSEQPPVSEEPPAKRPRGESSPSHLERCYPLTQDLPGGTPQTFSLQMDQLESTIYEATSGGRSVLFEDICDPEVATRAQTAKTFYMILDLCRQRHISLGQEVPYGPITISRD